MIGPRIPRSWLHDVENEAEDDRLSFEGWFTPDLYLSAAAMGVNVDESTFCQVALSGVMMGDVGAVAVIQEAHTRLLLANRVLEPEELIGGSPFAWDGEVRGDVYIDDLVLMIVGELCDGPPPEIVRRLEAADAAYGSHGMPVKRDKSEDPALAAEFWGATLHGGTGRYGFNLERRASLAATTLFALAFGVSGDELRRLLGVWSYCLGFRREGMSALGVAYQAAQSMPRRRRIMLSGPAFNELMSLAFLWPLLETDLRADPTCDRAGRPIVVATDAAGEGGLGACIGAVVDEHGQGSVPLWSRLHALSEEKGEYVRLDWAEAGSEEGGAAEDAHPEPQSRRAIGYPGSQVAGRGVCPVGGVEGAAAPSPAASVRRAAHINVLEARAIMLSMRKLVKQGVQNSRIVVLSDSRVCVGAFSKGRSSSRKLNAVIRRVGALLLRSGCTLDVVWIPTWANPADAPSRGASLEEWRAKVPAAPSLELFGAARPRSTVTCGTGSSVPRRRSWGGRAS